MGVATIRRDNGIQPMTVEIEYCLPCGFRERALNTVDALLAELGRDVDGVTLTPGHEGVFMISVGEKVIFDKDEGRYDINEIIALSRRISKRLRERTTIPVDRSGNKTNSVIGTRTCTSSNSLSRIVSRTGTPVRPVCVEPGQKSVTRTYAGERTECRNGE